MTKKKAKKNKKGISYHLGNFLLIGSAVVFLLVFYPLIKVYLFPPEIKNVQLLNGNYITVPKIHAQAPLIFNVDPFNENSYKQELKKGVAHAKNTALPGERGTIFIFAHSSGNPIEMTNYNTVFLRLGDLEKNDEVIISKDKQQFKYKVIEKRVVWPNEVKYLKEEKDQLILQTCWPIGTSLKRLLIFAKPV